MKDDIKNLKKLTDLALKDICVTDELKNKTLKLCKKEKSSILKPFLAAASSAAIIAVSITGYQYFSHKTSSNLTDKQIVNNTSNSLSKNSINNTEKTVDTSPNNILTKNDSKNSNVTKNANKSNDTASKNTSKDKKISVDTDKSNHINSEISSSTTNDTKPLDKPSQKEVIKNDKDGIAISNPPPVKDSYNNNFANNDSMPRAATSIAPVSKTLSTADAEKYWGDKLFLPSYIPNDFELTDISIPRDNKEIYVKLTYSSKNNYFKITQNKSTKYTVTGKSIDINGNPANIVQDKDQNDKDIIITQITWIKDNIQYSVVGNIPDTELINISKTIN